MPEDQTTGRKVPTLALTQEYEYDGVKYAAGDAVPVADPVAFIQLQRAEKAHRAFTEIVAETSKAAGATPATGTGQPRLQPAPDGESVVLDGSQTANKE